MWAYRLALALGSPLRLHERLAIDEETDPALRRLVADRYFHQGRALRDRGRFDEALTALQRGAFVDPQHPGIHGTVGAIFLHLGRHHEAVPWLERAVELDPRQAEWHTLLAQARERTGRAAAALRAYEAALLLAPDSVAAREGAQRIQDAQRRRAGAAPWRPWWEQPWSPAGSNRP